MVAVFNADDLAADGTVEAIRDELTALQKRFNFDCVQLIASAPAEDGETRSYTVGRGNWFARLGLARMFVLDCERQENDRESGGPE